MDDCVRRLRRLIPLAILIVTACDDPFGPVFWDASPDTLLIYSASRPEYIGQVSAVDIATTSAPVLALPIESPAVTGNWDFALLDDQGGLALVAAGAFAGLDSRARIAVLPDRTLESVTRAPRDTASFTAEPVPIEAGTVYVIRSRRASCGLSSGYRYAKLRAVAIDEVAGTFRFEVVRNPICDDRSFVPPEE